MPNGATLVVKILADISDFEKNLPKAERQLLKSADKVTDAGKKMALGITLPFVALGGALAKAAADDAASVAKIQRTFGSGAQAMEAWITQLMRTVPETDDAIRGLAVSTDTLLRSMGLGANAAMRMTQSVTTLAGDLAAYGHTELSVAQDALEKALAGKTKGLQQFGIVINEADIKTRAYRMGLAKVGDELTHAQTAQAAWSLVLDKSKIQQGEAARTINDDANALARMRQAADGAGDAFGAVFLPTAAKVVNAITDILHGLEGLPSGAKTAIVSIGGIAAAAGPALMIVGSLAGSFTKLNGALVLLSGTTATAGLVKLVTTLGPIALLAAAGALAVYDLNKAFEEQDAKAEEATKNTKEYVEYLKALGRAHAHAPKPKDDPVTGDDAPVKSTADRMKEISDRAGAVTNSIEQMKKGWEPIPGLGQQWVDVMHDAQTMLDGMKNKMDPIAVKAREIMLSLKEAFNPQSLNNIPGVQNGATTSLMHVDPGPSGNATVRIGGIVAPAPNVAPIGAIQAGVVAPLSRLEGATREGFNQVSVAIGDTLAQNLSVLLGGRGVGAQIGGSIGGAFGGGFASSLFQFAGKGALATAGNAVVPVVGGVIGTLLGGAIGGLFGHHKKSVDDSAASLDKLATTTDKVTESISNLAQGFKVAYARYVAAAPVDATGGGGGSGGGGGGGGGTGGGDPGGSPLNRIPGVGAFSVHIANATFHGVQDVVAMAKQLGEYGEVQVNRGGSSALTLGFGATG